MRHLLQGDTILVLGLLLTVGGRLQAQTATTQQDLQVSLAAQRLAAGISVGQSLQVLAAAPLLRTWENIQDVVARLVQPDGWQWSTVPPPGKQP